MKHFTTKTIYFLKSRPLNLIDSNQLRNNLSIKEFEEKPVALLESQIGSIVKSIQKLLRYKNAKTRQDCFLLLTQLVNVLPGALNNHLTQIIPGVSYSLK